MTLAIGDHYARLSEELADAALALGLNGQDAAATYAAQLADVYEKLTRIADSLDDITEAIADVEVA